MSERSKYYYEMKDLYGALAPEQKLQALCRELGSHIETLKALVEKGQAVDSRLFQKEFPWHESAMRVFTEKVQTIDNLRIETLSGKAESESKISYLHYLIGMPLSAIYGYADVILHSISEVDELAIPDEYEYWVNDIARTVLMIWDLFFALTGKRVQD